MYILDFGSSLIDLQDKVKKFSQFNEEQKLILTATVSDIIKGFNKEDMLCFKSGYVNLIFYLTNFE